MYGLVSGVLEIENVHLKQREISLINQLHDATEKFEHVKKLKDENKSKKLNFIMHSSYLEQELKALN